MRALVTGGAGYIGSVVAAELVNNGHEVIIVDDLRQGHRQAVPPGAEFFRADICNKAGLEKVFRSGKIEAVMHLAAESTVSLSMTDPGKFFETNVTGGINLLDTMRKYGVRDFIFSSTAAVYGEPETTPIEEGHATVPVNSYGESKLMFERILDWYGRAYGIRHISLRYFNAAGASGDLGEDHRPETHLIPNLLKATFKGVRQPVPLFGTDYATRDGSCIRDYVHVRDIAQAHILALQRLDRLSGRAYNLGNGDGYSVIEVIAAARRVTGGTIPVKSCPRRPGDPAVLVASSEKARQELGWRPRCTGIEDIIESVWQWHREHPEGYPPSE